MNNSLTLLSFRATPAAPVRVEFTTAVSHLKAKLTPCPYLPVSVGNLKEESFVELWNESETFQNLRNRDLLEGKCGACEFREVCGGCRARAYATAGNYLAEDASCEYQPGQYGAPPVQIEKKIAFATETDYDLQWTPAAEKRLKRVPSFARGNGLSKALKDTHANTVIARLPLN